MLRHSAAANYGYPEPAVRLCPMQDHPHNNISVWPHYECNAHKQMHTCEGPEEGGPALADGLAAAEAAAAAEGAAAAEAAATTEAAAVAPTSALAAA